MNPLNLKNNALFLSCWYERSRPVQMICFVVLILSIMFLSFMNVASYEKDVKVVWKSFFYVIAMLQAVILLVQGTMFAGHMGSRERTSETLDFHRNSPEPVANKIFGLVFGSTWFEWAAFFVFFIMELPFVLLPSITITHVLLWNASLLLTGIFFHTSGAAISLLSTKKKRSSSFMGILLFIFIGGPFLFHFFLAASSPFFYHLFGITASKYILVNEAIEFSGKFYTWEFPLIVMQVLVQVPLFVLMVNGLKRVFRMPNSPAWSKADVLSFCGFLFFMITGFFLASYSNIEQILQQEKGYRYFYPFTFEGFFKKELYLYVFLFVGVGFLISFFSVPSYFKRSKYVVLSQKGLIKNRLMFDDGATSLFTVIAYTLIGGMFMAPYAIIGKSSFGVTCATLLLLCSYILAFSGFLEFYRLSRFRSNKLFLITVLLVWWVFIPWTVMIVLSNNNMVDHGFITSISPLFGVGRSVSLLTGEYPVKAMALITPCLMAVVAWGLAIREHSFLEKLRNR